MHARESANGGEREFHCQPSVWPWHGGDGRSVLRGRRSDTFSDRMQMMRPALAWNSDAQLRCITL